MIDYSLERFNLDTKTWNQLTTSQSRTIVKLGLLSGEYKTNCIAYIICNRYMVFNSLFNKGLINLNDIIETINDFPFTLSYLSREILNNDAFVNLVINNIKKEWYDYLPANIANIEEVQRKCDRTSKIYLESGLDKNGYNMDCLNEDGELIQFFNLKANFPIKSKEDYFKLYKEYIDSKISVSSFCKKYGIDSIDGFNKFLKRVEGESFTNSSQIKAVKSDVQKEFFQFSKENAIKIANRELSFEEFINDEKVNFNSTKVDLYFNALSSDDKNKFAKVIIDYLENYPYLIKSNFMNFMNTGSNIASSNIALFIKKNLHMPSDREYLEKLHKEIEIIKQHEKTYWRKDLYRTIIFKDNKYEVNDDVIDQAYSYCNDNHYHVSPRSMVYLTKEIAKGNIDYSLEVNNEKEELIDTIIQLINESANIEDYLETMKNKRGM